MKFELAVSYLNELNGKIEFYNKFNFFGMKMDMNKKLFGTKSIDIHGNNILKMSFSIKKIMINSIK